jgi:hypothetical protein
MMFRPKTHLPIPPGSLPSPSPLTSTNSNHLKDKEDTGVDEGFEFHLTLRMIKQIKHLPRQITSNRGNNPQSATKRNQDSDSEASFGPDVISDEEETL